MKGLDTKVLIRYLVEDDVPQARKAASLIEEKGVRLFLNHVVLCEIVWVLELAYKYQKSKILLALEKILLTKQFEIEEKSVVWLAFHDYKSSSADFSDCLIGRKNQLSGCENTVTFDRSLESLDTFALL